jgi:hypothetical protein
LVVIIEEISKSPSTIGIRTVLRAARVAKVLRIGGFIEPAQKGIILNILIGEILKIRRAVLNTGEICANYWDWGTERSNTP